MVAPPSTWASDPWLVSTVIVLFVKALSGVNVGPEVMVIIPAGAEPDCRPVFICHVRLASGCWPQPDESNAAAAATTKKAVIFS